MNEALIPIAAGLFVVITVGIAGFQLLLFLGYPLAAYSWGGAHEGVLPPRLRRMSLLSAPLLLAMGAVMLVHTNLIEIGIPLPTEILVWAITAFLGLSTLGNLASRSKKEKLVMTPIAGIAFASSLFICVATL
ncbi:hypothetical protein FE782_07485 [Paenibacillus antri]|uniref:Uncharacterized protein n=1 Tax=Paenibacillus antri TaxID=2582848 RepID=A0A5R9GMK8_9BACL|nr:hypothetical protein [Paenibacillus antri]TLS53195.1 hypothetical protein FE782_07485 [Paenibacillus antri]